MQVFGVTRLCQWYLQECVDSFPSMRIGTATDVDARGMTNSMCWTGLYHQLELECQCQSKGVLWHKFTSKAVIQVSCYEREHVYLD